MLDTRAYAAHCTALCGAHLHHNPYGAEEPEQAARYAATLAAYDAHFPEAPCATFWPTAAEHEQLRLALSAMGRGPPAAMHAAAEPPAAAAQAAAQGSPDEGDPPGFWAAIGMQRIAAPHRGRLCAVVAAEQRLTAGCADGLVTELERFLALKAHQGDWDSEALTPSGARPLLLDGCEVHTLGRSSLERAPPVRARVAVCACGAPCAVLEAT